VLCQLSYCPSVGRALYPRVIARPRRRSLGVLFTVLTAGFAAVTAYAAVGGAWIIAIAAGALTAWMGDLAFRSLR
jgi:hypothetical protein